MLVVNLVCSNDDVKPSPVETSFISTLGDFNHDDGNKFNCQSSVRMGLMIGLEWSLTTLEVPSQVGKKSGSNRPPIWRETLQASSLAFIRFTIPISSSANFFHLHSAVAVGMSSVHIWYRRPNVHNLLRHIPQVFRAWKLLFAIKDYLATKRIWDTLYLWWLVR